MRVSDSMNYDQVKGNMSKNRSEMSDLQNQAATMKRVTRPSDDPVAAARVLSARTEIAGIEQFMKDLNNAKSYLDATDHAMEELTELMVRAKELALNQASASSANPATRKAVATEVDQIFSQAVAVGNRMLGDRYIFGGYQTTSPPFTQNGDYNGDQGLMTIEINKDVYLPMNLPGGHVFIGNEISTKNVIDKEFEVAPRTAEHVRNLQDPDRNPKQDVESPEEPVEKKGPGNGRGIEVRGLASNDVSSSENLEKIKQAENVFDVLRTFSTALKTSDTPMIQDSIERIDNAMKHVITSRAQVGSRAKTLDSVMNTLQKTKVDAQAQASSAEDADAYSLFSDITKNEATLQATLQTSGRLIQPSLLDFIR